MLYTNFSEKLLGIQDVEVKNIEENEKNIYIKIEHPRKECTCPLCGRQTKRIHDYRQQKIKDITVRGKKVILLLRKRRYVCTCRKRFYEPNTYIGRYQRTTKRAIESIIGNLASVKSYAEVAREYGTSSNTVIRYFKAVNYPKPSSLPEVIGIDEFKRYQWNLPNI